MPGNTSKHEPTGITDKAADNAHDFLEGAEQAEHKAHPEAQLDRGEHVEPAEQQLKGLGAKVEGQAKSKMDSIKEALHLKDKK